MKLLLFIIIIFCSFQGLCQTQLQWTLRGYVADKDSRQCLPNASAALLRPSDSSLIANEYADNKGAFVIAVQATGQYILQVSFLGHESLLIQLTLNTSEMEKNLDTVFLKRAPLTLKTVEIRENRSAITIKKDTIEYNAGSFKIRENAELEELLKRLPGMVIQNDGTISFQGQPITNLLIDGTPFFSNDPTVILKNLPADIVDRIQLLDRKLDNAEFGGINNGKREKVLNLTVKKNRKKKIFGRAAIGYGTNSRFAVNGNLNRLSDLEQVSFFGKGNNVNNANFPEHIGNAGSGGNGITKSWSAGLNFSRKYNEKLKISNSYVANADNLISKQTGFRHNILVDTNYYYKHDKNLNDKSTKHSFRSRMEYKPDSINSLTIASGLNYINSNSQDQNNFESFDSKQELANSGRSVNSKVKTNHGFYITTTWDKKFRKQGRSITSSISISKSKEVEESYNKSSTWFKREDGRFVTDSLDQLNEINTNSRQWLTSVTYTEPVFKDHFAEISGSFISNYSSLAKFTHDYNYATGKYNQLNDSLSNSFNNSSDLYFSRLSLSGRKVEWNYGLGLNFLYGDVCYQSSHQAISNTLGINYYFDAFLLYMVANGKRLHINYSGGISLPTVEQLQPTPDNSNPLYIQQGNPGLKTAFVHSAYIEYNAVHAKKLRSFSAGINGTFLNNKSVSATWLDSLGRQVSQLVNASGAYNIKATIVNAFPLKPANTTINLTTELSFDNDITFTNGVKGNIHNYNAAQTVSYTYVYKEIFDLAVSGNFRYGASSYSIKKDDNNYYSIYAFSLTGNLNLPAGFSVGFNLDYQLNTGRAAGYNTDLTLLNAYIGKTVFSGRQGLIRLQSFDMLNQNKSISRNVGRNYIEDIQSNVLRQFFIISFTYFIKPHGFKGR